MSVPSTNNTALLFVTRRPAWEQRVKLRQAMPTDLFTARSGLEQRTGWQTRCRWALRYTATMDRATALARAVRTFSEIEAPLIVPFWTERGILTTGIVGDVVTTDRQSGPDWFTAGEYILLNSAAEGDQFRRIASASGATLTLEPDVDGIDYLTGATVWPCRACIREAGSASVSVAIEESQTESLSYITL